MNDIAAKYAQNYWEAGNQVINLIFGVAFGVYVLLALNKKVRTLLAEYLKYVVAIAVLGNVGLAFLVYRMHVYEEILLVKISNDQTLVDAVGAGLQIRLWLLFVNFVMYVGILYLVSKFERESK